MGSTVFFHNGFGDYVINRGALSVLAQGLPHPTRLIYGNGPHAFLVRNLAFDAFSPVDISAPNGGQGREFSLPQDMDDEPVDVLVNLSSWEGPSMARLRERLQPGRYIWNEGWQVWDEQSRNAVELAYQAVGRCMAGAQLPDLRAAPQFEPALGNAVERLYRQVEAQGFFRQITVHLDSSVVKQWPVEALGEVLCRLLSENADLCILVVGREDRLPRCSCHGRRIQFMKDYSLEASMCIVAKSSAFLGVDSCMMKVADVAGVNGAGLFSTLRDARRWGYFWTPAEHAVLETDTVEDIQQKAWRGLSRALHTPREEHP